MKDAGNKKTIADQIFDGLKNAASEIEELRLQAALGRAEAKEAFEKLKKSLDTRLHEAKATISGFKENENVLELVNAFEHLQVQLALGIAESKEAFEHQEKKISQALAALEAKILGHETYRRTAGPLKMEVEKFKIKLELLALHYKLDKISMQEDFKEKKTELLARLDALRNSMTSGKAREQWDHFQDEISEAFSHLKKAFVGKQG